MNSQAVSKTFRLLPEWEKFISIYAKEQHLSLSKALQDLLKIAKKQYQRKQFIHELDELSKDEKFLKECEDWADANLD